MVVGLRRSRTGRVLIAIRENEQGGAGLRRQRHPHEPGGLRPVGLPGRRRRRPLRAPADRASAPDAVPAPAQPRAVHHGGDRRTRLAARRAAGRHLRVLGRLLPAGRVAVPRHRRRPAAGAARVPQRLRRRARRPARRRSCARSPPAAASSCRACWPTCGSRRMADEPPEETVLAEAAEIAELAEADEPRRRGRRAPAPVAAVDGDAPGDAETVPDGAARRATGCRATGPATATRPRRCGRDPPDETPVDRGRRRGGRWPASTARAPIDAIDGGGAGEDAAAIVRSVAAGATAHAARRPTGRGRPAGGPWARWKQRTDAGRAVLPAGRAVRPQHGRRARPHGVRRAAARDPRPLRPRQQRHPHGRVAVAGGGADPGPADRLLRRPRRRLRIAGTGARDLGDLLAADRPGAPACWVLGAARAGVGLGRAVNDPVHNSLLADYYDIPARPRVYAVHRYANALGQFLGPMVGRPHRPSPSVWRAPFFVFADRHRRASSCWRSGCGSRSAATSSARRWASSDDVADTEEEPPSWAESFRIVWQVRDAAPDLRRPAVRRHRHRRPAHAERALLRRGLRPRRAGRGASPPPASRAARSSSACCSASRSRPGSWPRARATSSASSARCRFGIAAAWVVFALAPTLPVAIVANAVGVGGLLPADPRHLRDAVAGRARQGALVRLRHRHAVHPARPACCCRSSAGSPTTTASAPGCCVAAPVFVIGGLILASAGNFVEHDIAQVWKSTAARVRGRPAAPAGQGQAAARRATSTSTTTTCRCCSASTSRSTRARSSPCWAPTAPASRRCCGPSPASCRPSARRHRVRRPRHHPHAARRDRRPRRVGGPRRPGRVPQLTVADNLRLAGWTSARRRAAEVKADTERVLETCSRSCASASTSRPATCPAASSRC